MTSNRLHVAGIMIDRCPLLYQIQAQWTDTSDGGSERHQSLDSRSLLRGSIVLLNNLRKISGSLTHVIIVFDASTISESKLTFMVKKIRQHLGSYSSTVSFVKIGDKKLDEKILNSFQGDTYSIKPTNPINSDDSEQIFQSIIDETFENHRKELFPDEDVLSEANAVKPSQTDKAPASSILNISMMVLGGFIAAAGALMVAVAFLVLNAATFGGAGMAVIGASALLSGMGIFASASYNQNTIIDESPVLML